jgi:hypothetical protein
MFRTRVDDANQRIRGGYFPNVSGATIAFLSGLISSKPSQDMKVKNPALKLIPRLAFAAATGCFQ